MDGLLRDTFIKLCDTVNSRWRQHNEDMTAETEQGPHREAALRAVLQNDLREVIVQTSFAPCSNVRYTFLHSIVH